MTTVLTVKQLKCMQLIDNLCIHLVPYSFCHIVSWKPCHSQKSIYYRLHLYREQQYIKSFETTQDSWFPLPKEYILPNNQYKIIVEALMTPSYTYSNNNKRHEFNQQPTVIAKSYTIFTCLDG